MQWSDGDAISVYNNYDSSIAGATYSAGSSINVLVPVDATSVKATYGLGSLPFEDSDLIVFAMFRKSSQKEALINEYIRSCMKYLTLLKEKRSMTDDEYILHSDQG